MLMCDDMISYVTVNSMRVEAGCKHTTPSSHCGRALNGAEWFRRCSLLVLLQTANSSSSSARSWHDGLFNCLIQIACHHRPETATSHICPSGPGNWLPLGALCLALVHSHLLSVSMSVIRTSFLQTHKHSLVLFSSPSSFCCWQADHQKPFVSLQYGNKWNWTMCHHFLTM